MRKGSIYIIKNKCNDKVYIGQTMQSVENRFKQHSKPSTIKKRGTYKLYNAFKKYGINNFYFEILEEEISKNELNSKEIYYIEKYNSYKLGYNSTNGGESKAICKITDIELLKEMFFSGKKYEEIANFFKVSKVTVQRTLHSLKIKRNLILTKEYLLKNKDIKTNKQIAKEFNISPASVSRAYKRYNIKKGTGSLNILNIQNKSKITKEMLERFVYLPNKDIAEKLNISISYVSVLLKKYNMSKSNKIKCIDYPAGE